MKLFISLILIFISIFMYFLNHPLSMGLMILTQTLMMTMLSGMLIKSYWFSYILFLTFLGGLLVLFIYTSSVASNEMFQFSINMKIMLLIFLLTILLILFLFYPMNWMNLNQMSEMENFFYNMLFLNNENKINLSKLYNSQNFLLMLMLIIYLFITLIAIIKITNIFYGPLRTLK
uniref:NADH-ubiquinone oxidoreductase chain 6 n=1 Tax=Rhodoneura mellea TaxID=1529670 RepID=A0A076EBB5_9NEOP|nr:NADH dehydrogenase subunit 6 [Rhodoneura mellea]